MALLPGATAPWNKVCPACMIRKATAAPRKFRMSRVAVLTSSGNGMASDPASCSTR